MTAAARHLLEAYNEPEAQLWQDISSIGWAPEPTLFRSIPRLHLIIEHHRQLAGPIYTAW